MSEIIVALEKHGDALDHESKLAFFTDVIKAIEQQDADSLEDCVGKGSRAYDNAYWALNPPDLEGENDSENDGDTESEKFWLSVGDIVEHVKEPGGYGVVIGIDDNLIESHGVTTCRIVWYDSKNVDVQWSNKLRLVENDPN